MTEPLKLIRGLSAAGQKRPTLTARKLNKIFSSGRRLFYGAGRG